MQSTPGLGSQLLSDVVAEATGQERRHDPVLPVTGGPAGNAALTAWTGLVLLVLSAAELLTLVDVRGLISWHVALGALLVPPALLKTGTTGWRILRYYRGHTPYVEAGPPPMVLRVLGPLVVASTLGLLGSGILLILLGQDSSQQNLVSALGLGVSWVSVHQGFFVVWCGATGLHLLGRIIPALRISFGSERVARLPGTWVRAALVGACAVAAVALAVALVHADGSWHGFSAFGSGDVGDH